MNKEYLNKYAKLLVQSGLNVKKNQTVVIRCPIEAVELVRLIVKECYRNGAYDVIVKYNDEVVTHERYLNANENVFNEVEDYEAAFYNDTAKKGACYLSLVGEDPDLMKDVDPSRMMNFQKSMRQKTRFYRDKLDFMECQWCVASVATKDWAKKVYPELEESAAVNSLWEAIFKVSRVDENDPNENWSEHKKSFENRVNKLNSMDIDYFHYTNSLGTDLTVKMPKGYVFCGGGSYLKDGTYYFANIPTEEVFSTPHRLGVNGRLVASMPLVHHGNLIEDFWFEFKDGKIIDFDAKKGKDVLESILDADEGSRYLGEIALVPYGSPISVMDTLFYETLIDENASCHFALGQSYAECLEDALSQDEETQKERGANQSLVHVDFMVGTKDLCIDAYTHENKKVSIFSNGKFSSEFD